MNSNKVDLSGLPEPPAGHKVVFCQLAQDSDYMWAHTDQWHRASPGQWHPILARPIEGPEPELKKCPRCGTKMRVDKTPRGNWKAFCLANTTCCFQVAAGTRRAAIEAANSLSGPERSA